MYLLLSWWYPNATAASLCPPRPIFLTYFGLQNLLVTFLAMTVIGALALEKNLNSFVFLFFHSLDFEVGTIPFVDYTIWKSITLLFN